jgi:hypothetical protein
MPGDAPRQAAAHRTAIGNPPRGDAVAADGAALVDLDRPKRMPPEVRPGRRGSVAALRGRANESLPLGRELLGQIERHTTTVSPGSLLVGCKPVKEV